MNVLFLDDDAHRLKLLIAHMEFSPTFEHALTSHEAIDMMSKKKYDVLMLDHDLGDCQPDDTGDGTAVAEWINVNRDKVGAPYIVIHSFNSPAARRMSQILDDVDCPVPILISFNPRVLAGVLKSIDEILAD